MRSKVNSLLWLVPFVSFLSGYLIVRHFSYNEIIITPNVMGRHINDAIKELSAFQLNARILAEKEDPDMPDGFIISQSPEPNHKVKPYQSVFLVITKKPQKPFVPTLYGLSLEAAQKQIKSRGLKLKTFYIENNAPFSSCIGQSLIPHQVMDDPFLIGYFSSGTSSLRICPLLKGISTKVVRDFFKNYSIDVTVYHTTMPSDSHVCESCVVVDQRPLAGSFIDLKKPVSVQLTVN